MIAVLASSAVGMLLGYVLGALLVIFVLGPAHERRVSRTVRR